MLLPHLSDPRYWIVVGATFVLGVVTAYATPSKRVAELAAMKPGSTALIYLGCLASIALVVTAFVWFSWREGIACLMLYVFGAGIGGRLQKRRLPVDPRDEQGDGPRTG